jgi:hypothetical protein
LVVFIDDGGIAVLVEVDISVKALDVEGVDADGVGVGWGVEVAAAVIHLLVKSVVVGGVELASVLFEGRVVEYGAEEVSADG